MKRFLIFVFLLSIPILLSLEVWQVFRYRSLESEVSALEEQQKEWLEKNKKILANISLFRSPERIERVALEDLGLESIDYTRVIQVRLSGARLPGVRLPGAKGF
ncbi:MAG TPA: septum formation initiator family protein [Spirochaetia bacterium]|nr:septum formation initiator family protein [Spirochaetia bacterium]